jgi:O-antigen ligase
LGAALGVILALRKRVGIVLPVIVALIGLIVMHQLGIARMDTLSTGESSAEGRIKSWAQGWYMLRSNPAVGVGPLNYSHYHPMAAHSSLVQIAAETGMLGLFCWIGFLYFPLRETIESMWHRRPMSTDPPFVVQQIQAALLVLFITGLFLSRAYTLLPYLLAGLVLCGRRLAETGRESQADSLQKFWPRVSWMDLRRVAAAQMICILAWRFLARHYIEGI